MNGRIYDPGIGRFLSADPYVQFAFNTQSFNRYSYVLNNPLSFKDPSGFGIWDSVFAVFKFGIDLVRWATGHLSTNAFIASFCTAVAYLTLSTIPYVGPFVATLGAGFTSAFMSTILSGASLGQAVEAGTIGATIAAATYGLFRYGIPTIANALNPGTTAATAGAQINMGGHAEWTSAPNLTVAAVGEATAERIVVTAHDLISPPQVDIIQEVARDVGSGAGAAVGLSLADKIRNLLGIGSQSKSYLPRTRLPDSMFRGGNRLNEVRLKDVLDYGPIKQLVAYNNLHPEEALSMLRFAHIMNSYAWRTSEVMALGAPAVGSAGATIGVAGFSKIGSYLLQNPNEIPDFFSELVNFGGPAGPPPETLGGYYGWVVHQAIAFDPNDYYSDYYHGQ